MARWTVSPNTLPKRLSRSFQRAPASSSACASTRAWASAEIPRGSNRGLPASVVRGRPLLLDRSRERLRLLRLPGRGLLHALRPGRRLVRGPLVEDLDGRRAHPHERVRDVPVATGRRDRQDEQVARAGARHVDEPPSLGRDVSRSPGRGGRALRAPPRRARRCRSPRRRPLARRARPTWCVAGRHLARARPTRPPPGTRAPSPGGWS